METNDYVPYFFDPNYVNPYFVSSYPMRTSISHLGTAADNLIISPVPSITVSTDDYELYFPLSPVITTNQVSYENLNNDPGLLKKVTKYFYEKTMNVWLYSEFEKLLLYLVVDNKKVRPVKNKKELENNTLDKKMDVLDAKVKYITEHVIDKYDMRSFIKKYSIKSGLDLWKLKEHKIYVKKSIYKVIKKKLQNLAFH